MTHSNKKKISTPRRDRPKMEGWRPSPDRLIPTHNVFLSHITEEAAVAATLKDWIESTFAGQCGVFASSSGKDVIAGDNWLKEIKTALEQTEVFVVLCSPLSINRPWVNFETGCAWIKALPVVPVCHSGQTKDRLPQPLIQFQALEITDDNFAKSLIESLATYFRVDNLPKISYEQMLLDVRKAESAITKFSTDQAASPKNDRYSDSAQSSSGASPARSRTAATPPGQLLRLIFTTGLTTDNAPINSLNSFSMNDSRVYVFINWFGFRVDREYNFNWQFIDDGGDIVTAGDMTMHPTSSKWNSWHPYSFEPKSGVKK